MTVLQLKVCGARSLYEIDQAAAGGAGLVGLWHKLGGGDHELTAAEVTALSSRCRQRGLASVLVTFDHDAGAISALVARAGLTHVQLHAYQPPRVVGDLTARCPELTVVKVLHLDGDDCPEAVFSGAYERAGVDAFLADNVANGQVGSTGAGVAEESFVALVERCSRPVWLAGGVSARDDPGRIGRLRRLPGLAGLDVDRAARAAGGPISAPAIKALARAWGAWPSPHVDRSTPVRPIPDRSTTDLETVP